MSNTLTFSVVEVVAQGKIVPHVKLIDSKGFTCGIYETVAQAIKASENVFWNANRGKVNTKTLKTRPNRA